MERTIIGSFSTRRQAELAVEHLVQEHGIARTDVFIQAQGRANSAGTELAGADIESGHPVLRAGIPELPSAVGPNSRGQSRSRSIVTAMTPPWWKRRSRTQEPGSCALASAVRRRAALLPPIALPP